MLTPRPLPSACPCLQVLAWNSTDLDAYLTEAGRLVREVDGLLACIKGTVGQAQGILEQWQRDVMFERKEGRVSSHEELSGAMRDLIATRHAAVTGAGCRLLRAGQQFAEQPVLCLLSCILLSSCLPACLLLLLLLPLTRCCLSRHLLAFACADGGREISTHVTALARTLKVNKGAAAWRRWVGSECAVPAVQCRLAGGPRGRAGWRTFHLKLPLLHLTLCVVQLPGLHQRHCGGWTCQDCCCLARPDAQPGKATARLRRTAAGMAPFSTVGALPDPVLPSMLCRSASRASITVTACPC